MKIDNKKLLVLALLGGGALYLWKRRKPEVVTKEEPMGGGAGGAGGVFVPPTTITNIINTERPSGYFTKTPTKILESRKKDVKAADTALKDAAAAAKTAAGGLTADIRTGPNVTTPSSPTGPIGGAVTPPDPCGGVGIYDPVTKSCKVPSTGGGVVGSIPFSGKMPLTLDNLLH